MTALWVALLGAVGSLARWGVGVGVGKVWKRTLPLATLTVNVVGSIAIGFVMALYLARGELDSRARVALTAGLLGGFTTYSAFAFESWALWDRRSFGWAGAYVALTIAMCFAGCALGVAMGRWAAR